MSLKALIEKMDNILNEESDSKEAVEILTVNHADKGKIGSVKRYAEMNPEGKPIYSYRTVSNGKEDMVYRYDNEKDAITSLLKKISQTGGYSSGPGYDSEKHMPKTSSTSWKPGKFD